MNGKHVVFGEVVKGMEVVRAIERSRCNSSDKPLSPVVIADCGEIKETKKTVRDCGFYYSLGKVKEHS